MPLRYFENQYADLGQGQDIEIDYRLWKTRIREIVENILRKEASFPAQKGRQEETAVKIFQSKIGTFKAPGPFFLLLRVLYGVKSSLVTRPKAASLFADGGLYVGQAGLAYMLWYVSSRFPEMKLKEIAR